MRVKKISQSLKITLVLNEDEVRKEAAK